MTSASALALAALLLGTCADPDCGAGDALPPPRRAPRRPATTITAAAAAAAAWEAAGSPCDVAHIACDTRLAAQSLAP